MRFQSKKRSLAKNESKTWGVDIVTRLSELKTSILTMLACIPLGATSRFSWVREAPSPVQRSQYE